MNSGATWPIEQSLAQQGLLSETLSQKEKENFLILLLASLKRRELTLRRVKDFEMGEGVTKEEHKVVKDQDMLMTPRQKRNGRHWQTLHSIK